MANIKQQEEERLRLLLEIEQAEKRINAQNEKIAVSKSKEAKRLKAQMDLEKKQLETYKEQLKTVDEILSKEKKRKETAEKKRKAEEEAKKYQEDQLSSLAKLSPQVKQLLNEQVSQTGLVADITSRIIYLKRRENGVIDAGNGKRLEASAEQKAAYKLEREELEKQKALIIESAEAVVLAGMTEKQKEQAATQAQLNGLSEKGNQLFQNANALRKEFELREKRIKEIKNQQGKIFDSIPDKLKSIIKDLKGVYNLIKLASGTVLLWAGIAAAIGLGFKAMNDLSEAAKKFRQETGITVSQMKDIKKTAMSVTGEMAMLGASAEDVYDVIAKLKTEFGDIANISKDTVRALSVLNTNFGVANEDATEFISQLESMTGLSEQTATNYALQVTRAAKLARVSPKQVFKDIADSAKDTAQYFGTSFSNMVKTSIEARRLGATLKDVMGVSEQLLDFEGSIEDELKAAAFAQGQFNLTQARILAANKDYSGALDEVLNQLERRGRFADLDLFTQKALANSIKSTPAVLQKLINQREKLRHLSEDDKKLALEAIDNGLDINNATKEQLQTSIVQLRNEKEMQGVIGSISNTFKGIGMNLGTAILPLLELALTPISLMADGLNRIVGFIREYSTAFKVVLGIAGTYYAIQKAIVISQKQEAFFRLLNMKRAGALAALNALSNPVKALAGIAAAGLIVGTIAKFTSVGDMYKPAGDAEPIVSTREGGIFRGTKNDEVAMAPNLGARLAGGVANISETTNKATANAFNRFTSIMERIEQRGIVAYADIDGSKAHNLLMGVQNRNTRNTLGL